MISTHFSPVLSTAAPPTVAPQGPRVWAACVTLASSLGLVGLGGCFLVGVLALLHPELFIGGPCNDTTVIKPVTLSAEELALMFILYGLGFACFLGALLLFLVAVRGLWRVL